MPGTDLPQPHSVRTRARKANIRHELDPTKVAASVERALLRNESSRERAREEAAAAVSAYEKAVTEGTHTRWPRRPEGPGWVDPAHDKLAERQRAHYALVRIIELSRPARGKRFVLVYGDDIDAAVTSGTGPFDSIEAAAKWFYDGGR